MNKEMVELIEEIAKEIEGYGDVEFDYITHTEAAVSSETLAQRIITRVGKAILSGEYPKLDEALGVLGRAKTQGGDLLADTLATICGWDESPALSIIALRRKEEQ